MLTDKDKTLIKDSWRLVRPIASTASDLFYRYLFEHYPQYRDLFPADMGGQKRKLMQTLNFAVKALEWSLADWRTEVDAENDLFLVVLALGKRHKNLYRIPDDSYPPVGESLIWTLEQGLGDAFDDETRAAWIKLYEALSALMIMGSPQTSSRAQSAQ